MAVELSEQERSNLALLVMGILEEWRLTSEQQLTLLGIEEKAKPRELSRYRRGTPFPQDDDMLSRAKHVLGIQHSLHVIFPRNPNMPVFWIKNRNRQLKGAPLSIMLDEGLDGMHRVWRSLDCTVNWD